jgi:hypothetical protein
MSLASKQARLAAIKAATQRVQAKKLNVTFEEVEMKDIIAKLDARKAQVKADEKAAKKIARKLNKDLTAQVKKAGKQSPGSLEFNSPENMYYSDKNTARFLENSSYMDAYNANKSADGDY